MIAAVNGPAVGWEWSWRAWLTSGWRRKGQDLGAWVSANLAELFRTEDHKEGVAAFIEKRSLVFRGR